MLSELFAPGGISLDLAGQSRDDVLKELVGLLDVDLRSQVSLLKLLRRREAVGSTAVGRGVAIPHSRSLVVPRVRLAYGRHRSGLPYDALDDRPVRHFFLIVAPPVEISNQYLPVLGRIAQFVKEPDVPARLDALGGAAEFFTLLAEKGC